jgi:hypothetical protein
MLIFFFFFSMSVLLKPIIIPLNFSPEFRSIFLFEASKWSSHLRFVFVNESVCSNDDLKLQKILIILCAS